MDASLNSEGGIHFVLDWILLHDEGVFGAGVAAAVHHVADPHAVAPLDDRLVRVPRAALLVPNTGCPVLGVRIKSVLPFFMSTRGKTLSFRL